MNRLRFLDLMHLSFGRTPPKLYGDTYKGAKRITERSPEKLAACQRKQAKKRANHLRQTKLAELGHNRRYGQ